MIQVECTERRGESVLDVTHNIGSFTGDQRFFSLVVQRT